MREEQIEKISYWNIVWEQFSKGFLPMLGLFTVIALLLLAIYAPMISLDKPFYYISGDRVSFPWFAALFDRNFFENGVDIFFNIQMFLMPPFVVLIYFLNRFLKWRFFDFFPKLLLFYGLISYGLFLMIDFNPMKLPFQNWETILQVDRDKGESVSIAWPLKQNAFRTPNTMGRHPAQPSMKYWMGTDKEGRDVFSRMIFGTRISLTIGLVAVGIYIFIGVILGSCAGYFGGFIDLLISRLIEIMLCFPTFFLILTLSALIQERSIFHVMLIIGLTRWPEVARLVRAEFLKLKNMDYVQAAIALGFSKPRIIFGHILPNALGPVIVTAVFGIASSILIESSLSFLGLGDVTAPSWGEILSQGRQEFKLWLILAPGFAIFLVVSVFNLVGEGIQDAMDPKQRR